MNDNELTAKAEMIWSDLNHLDIDKLDREQQIALVKID